MRRRLSRTSRSTTAGAATPTDPDDSWFSGTAIDSRTFSLVRPRRRLARPLESRRICAGCRRRGRADVLRARRDRRPGYRGALHGNGRARDRGEPRWIGVCASSPVRKHLDGGVAEVHGDDADSSITRDTTSRSRARWPSRSRFRDPARIESGSRLSASGKVRTAAFQADVADRSLSVLLELQHPRTHHPVHGKCRRQPGHPRDNSTSPGRRRSRLRADRTPGARAADWPERTAPRAESTASAFSCLPASRASWCPWNSRSLLRLRLDDEALDIDLGAVGDPLNAEAVPAQAIDRRGVSA